MCSKYCVTRDSSDYLTYKTNQNLNFPFYPFSHLLMPNEFFDKKRTGVKTEQLKPHNNKGTLKSRGFLEYAICQLIVFLTVKGNHFSFMARIRIPRVLLDHQYNCIKTVPKGKANHHLFSTYSCERLNFPALAKIRSGSYSVTFVRERLQLLRWFFTWTTHLFSRKKLSLPREEPQVIFAIPAKEHFAGACAILVVCQ